MPRVSAFRRYEVTCEFFLNIVIRQRARIELLAREDETLLIGGEDMGLVELFKGSCRFGAAKDICWRRRGCC